MGLSGIWVAVRSIATFALRLVTSWNSVRYIEGSLPQRLIRNLELGMTLTLEWPWPETNKNKLNWCPCSKNKHFLTHVLDPDSITLILKLDLDIVNIPKMKFLWQILQKPQQTITHTHTHHTYVFMWEGKIFKNRF